MKQAKMQAEGLINLFVGLTELVLALRVIFRLFDAHTSASFVNWIYNTSDLLLTPFRNVFSSASVIEPRYVLDFTALFAMAVYAAAGYLLISWLGSRRK